jgi:transketolase
VFLLVGDLGYSVVEAYRAEFPDRFLNVGVAEQNMTGVAAGLASEGYHVFTYSIANFPVLRCFEQIRNDVCYHHLPVTIVAVGAGVAYGSLGYSHHAVQDIAVMSSLPELTILSPADPGETHGAVRWLAENPRPSYLRLGKAGERNLHASAEIDAGFFEVVRAQSDTVIVATGSILDVAIKASDTLQVSGHSASVISCVRLQPLPDGLIRLLQAKRNIFVLEEHFQNGGLGALLLPHLARESTLTSLHLPSETAARVGSQEFLRKQAHLTPDLVAAAILAKVA